MIFKEQIINDSFILDELPILEKNDNYFSPKNILIIESRFENNTINFSDVYDISKYNDTYILETISDIIDSHQELNNVVFLVNELKYYNNNNYRKAVLEVVEYYPTQFYKLNYETFFNNLLESIIENDIINGNTKNIDMLLSEGEFFNNISNMISGGLNNIGTTIHNFNTQVEKQGEKISNFLNKSTTEKTMQVGNYLLGKLDDHPELKKSVSNFMSEKSAKTAGELLNTAKNSFKNTLDNGIANTIKNTNLGTLLGGAIGAGSALIAHAPENATNAATNKLSSIKNAITQKISSLFNLQKDAPPEKKGIISQLIAKLKKMLSSLTSQSGTTYNN